MSKAEYDIVLFKDFLCKMRDGVQLATDIYRPGKNGGVVEDKFPTILERTPYNKERKVMAEKAYFFVKRGYVFIAQDCRGRFKSGGDFSGYTYEPVDGYDTVEWISTQTWSNGKVGTMGTSYGGWVQSALALLDPPHLASMFPNVSIFNAGLHSVRHGGAFEMRWLAWAFLRAADSQEASRSPAIEKALIEARFDELITRWPIKKGGTPIHLTPKYEKFAFDILTHSNYDEFWRKTGIGWMGDVEEYLEEHADVPMYYSGGWYDSYCRSTTEFFNKMSKIKKSPVKMIMGPWTHGDAEVFSRTYSGDVDFGPDASIDYNNLRLRWFDQTLKDVDIGILNEPPIKIFVMGGGDGRQNSQGRLNHGGKWRHEKEWPLARTKYLKYYIHQGGLLSREHPTEEKSSTTYIYDPKNPVPTIGGNLSTLNYLLPVPEGYESIERASSWEKVRLLGKPLAKIGAHDQLEAPDVYGANPPFLPLSSRHDVLVFQTTPLKEDLEITGPLRMELWASSSAVDTDFTVKLIDSHPPNDDYPNGYAMNLSDSIIRARYRDSFENPKLMKPGSIYKVIIQPYPTSNLFKKGHRIRIDISSSNWPRFDINPNTGEPLGLNKRTVKALNIIYHEASNPSHIVLPIIPK